MNKVATLGKRSLQTIKIKYLQVYVKVIVNQCIKVIVINSKCICQQESLKTAVSFNLTAKLVRSDIEVILTVPLYLVVRKFLATLITTDCI